MFKRIMTLIRGFVGLFVSGLEKSNPQALIEAEKKTCASRSRASTTTWPLTPGSSSA